MNNTICRILIIGLVNMVVPILMPSQIGAWGIPGDPFEKQMCLSFLLLFVSLGTFSYLSSLGSLSESWFGSMKWLLLIAEGTFIVYFFLYEGFWMWGLAIGINNVLWDNKARTPNLSFFVYGTILMMLATFVYDPTEPNVMQLAISFLLSLTTVGIWFSPKFVKSPRLKG